MKWMRLVIFVPTLIALVRFVGFDKFDRRCSPGRVFVCLMFALLIVGVVEWITNKLFGLNYD